MRDADLEARFTALVEAYQTPLLRMCCLWLEDQTMAEDAVQETFVKAWRAMPSFRADSDIKTWLMRIAINTCRDMRRSRWARHINGRVTPDMLPEKPADMPERYLEIEIAIAELPLKLREVILLYYYQDMQTDDIARALGIARVSVSGRLRRAREKLRETLKGAGFDE